MERLPDSGKREKSKSGALKEDKTGYGRYDLIPTEGLRRLAIRLEQGALKYGERNWEKGGSWSKGFSSMVRHAYQWLSGDRSEDHLAAIACWTFFLMHYEKHHNDKCDVPHKAEPVKYTITYKQK